MAGIQLFDIIINIIISRSSIAQEKTKCDIKCVTFKLI